MTKANSHPTTHDKSAAGLARRNFLTGVALTLPAAAAPAALAGSLVADPIFAAIEVHRAATAAAYAAMRAHGVLEAEIPRDKRQSVITVWEETIVETDDPRWIDSQRAVMTAWSAQDDAAVELLNVAPTTLAGVTALLRYAVEANVDDMGFPDKLLSSDGHTERSWHHLLVENVAAAIPQCA
jgi:hypothetical protein